MPRPDRFFARHKFTRMAAIAAFAIVAAAACTPAARSPGSDAGAGAAAAPSSQTAQAVPTESTGSGASSPGDPGSLSAGSHSSVNFTPGLRFDVPSGWTTVDDDDGYFVLGRPGTTSAIVLQTQPVIASDDQDCAGLAAPGAARTVDGIVGALRSDARLVTSVALPVTIGRFTGQVVDLQLAPGWTGTCKWSDGKPAALVLTVADPPGPFFGVIGRERVRQFLLEVGNDVVAIGIDSVDGSDFDSFVSLATPIVQSFRFTP
jgi:hypothetical protein